MAPLLTRYVTEVLNLKGEEASAGCILHRQSQTESFFVEKLSVAKAVAYFRVSNLTLGTISDAMNIWPKKRENYV